MEQPTAENTWYAVVYVTVGQNVDEPDENRYYSHTKVIMVSQSQSMISETADLLNKEHGYVHRKLTGTDVSEHLPDYVGKELYVTNEIILDDSAVEDYEKRGLIFGRPGFKPAFDCPSSELDTDQRDTI